MVILTVTARRQVTLRKEVLQHLGIKPGDKIELDLALCPRRYERRCLQVDVGMIMPTPFANAA
jgi:hypothetical protein